MEMLGVLIVATLCGVIMKIADLLNEHGLRWFRHDAILFGFLWGAFGNVLVFTTTPVVVSALTAMNVAFIGRGRLDYPNHQIAATGIIFAAIISNSILPELFAVFFIVFVTFGWIKDYVDDELHLEGWFAKLNELMLYYPIPTLVYSHATGEWILFEIFGTYTLAYNIVKAAANRYGYL